MIRWEWGYWYSRYSRTHSWEPRRTISQHPSWTPCHMLSSIVPKAILMCLMVVRASDSVLAQGYQLVSAKIGSTVGLPLWVLTIPCSLPAQPRAHLECTVYEPTCCINHVLVASPSIPPPLLPQRPWSLLHIYMYAVVLVDKSSVKPTTTQKGKFSGTDTEEI